MSVKALKMFRNLLKVKELKGVAVLVEMQPLKAVEFKLKANHCEELMFKRTIELFVEVY